jgi:hypothetical protein
LNDKKTISCYCPFKVGSIALFAVMVRSQLTGTYRPRELSYKGCMS